MDADKKADRTTKRTTLRWAESIDKLNGHFKRNEFETRARATKTASAVALPAANSDRDSRKHRQFRVLNMK